MRSFLFLCSLFLTVSIASAQSPIHILTVNGDITPATHNYIEEGIYRAEDAGAQAVIIELNTPGGMLDATRDIVTDLLTTTLPVIVYVSPQGSRAASAGTFIAMAAHVAAMAPGTNIGAAHPVSTQGEMDSIMSSKVTNDAAAFIRSIAEQRHRNAVWAEEAVRKSVSITETEALRNRVIDLIAPSFDALLDSLDGRTITVGDGMVTLSTANAQIIDVPMSWRIQLLDLLSDPNITYILFLIGIYGLFFELYNPGAVLPGVAGAISIILALYAMQTLPLNFAGLALIIVGIVLFILEVKIISYGLLSLAGVVALFFGSVMLFRSEDPLEYVEVSLGVIIPFVISTALFFFFVVGAGLRAQQRKVSTGEQAMIGLHAVVVTPLAPAGTVKVSGEVWNAVSADGPAESGTSVIITAVNGLQLTVKHA